MITSNAMQANQSVYDKYLFTGNSLIGGFTGAFTVFPINVIVGRKQRDGFSTNIIKIIREEGILGIYKGFVPRGVATAFEKTLKVHTNAAVLSYLHSYQELLSLKDIYSRILAGASAGIAQAVFITTAMERVSLVMSTHGIGEMNKRLSLTEAIQKAQSTGGILRGIVPCIMRDAPFSAVYFPFYAYLFQSTDNSFIAAGTAGALSAFAVTPADVIKTKMQTTESNTLSLAVASINRQGLSTYFTGAGLRAFRSGIQFAVNFWILETLNASVKSRHAFS